jgi:hypothetical protein
VPRAAPCRCRPPKDGSDRVAGPDLLTHAAAELNQDRMRAALARHAGISATDLDALEHLEADGPLTQRDLGERLSRRACERAGPMASSRCPYGPAQEHPPRAWMPNRSLSSATTKLWCRYWEPCAAIGPRRPGVLSRPAQRQGSWTQPWPDFARPTVRYPWGYLPPRVVGPAQAGLMD